MSGHGELKHFPTAPGVPIVGRPFTFTQLLIPVSALLTCHCGGTDTTVQIVLSTPGMCPSCHKTYNVVLNPTTMQLEIAMGAAPEQVPS